MRRATLWCGLAVAVGGSFGVLSAQDDFRRGDPTDNGHVDFCDAIFLLNFFFGLGPAPFARG